MTAAAMTPHVRTFAELAPLAPELVVVDVDASTIEESRGRLPVLATSRFGIAVP